MAQPIFVQAPEAPNPRGNRAATGAIGLVAALSFAVLYLAAWLGFGALAGDVTIDNVGEVALGALGTWSLWVTVLRVLRRRSGCSARSSTAAAGASG